MVLFGESDINAHHYLVNIRQGMYGNYLSNVDYRILLEYLIIQDVVECIYCL